MKNLIFSFFLRNSILLSLYMLIPITLSGKVYDSYLNIYKETVFSDQSFNEIANTTWKEFFISENVTNLIKCVPVFIDDDRDVDLLVLDSESRLYWVSNIRGTSKEVKHQFISSKKLHDFVISNKINYSGKNFKVGGNYILGINSYRDKILKYNLIENEVNKTISWNEQDFIDLSDDNLSYITNSQIVSIHLSQYESDENRQLLLVGLKNYYDYSTDILKVTIYDSKIENISLIKFKSNIRIIGAYDMNRDGLIDVVYSDSNNNLYIMVNDDPYYHQVFVANINTVMARDIPRLFIIDSDRDTYPDIITADRTANTIGILFNLGAEYWKGIKYFYQVSQNREKIYNYGQWTFIPLIDYYEEKLGSRSIRDFTVFQISAHKRINFEIFAIYDNKLYWFIEKHLNIKQADYGNHVMLQNYMYCMTKCDIVVDQQNSDTLSLDYHFIVDVDINGDLYPEFIIYSSRDTCLYWIKKYVPYLSGFGWNSNFWIYIIIYIYIVSSIVGMWEFYRLKKLNDQISMEKLLMLEHKNPNNKLEGNFDTF